MYPDASRIADSCQYSVLLKCDFRVFNSSCGPVLYLQNASPISLNPKIINPVQREHWPLTMLLNIDFTLCLETLEACVASYNMPPLPAYLTSSRVLLSAHRARSDSDSDMPIKQCPICGIYIERNQGCAQMLCKSCKHTFCWYCLQNLDVSVPCCPTHTYDA